MTERHRCNWWQVVGILLLLVVICFSWLTVQPSGFWLERWSGFLFHSPSSEVSTALWFVSFKKTKIFYLVCFEVEYGGPVFLFKGRSGVEGFSLKSILVVTNVEYLYHVEYFHVLSVWLKWDCTSMMAFWNQMLSWMLIWYCKMFVEYEDWSCLCFFLFSLHPSQNNFLLAWIAYVQVLECSSYRACFLVLFAGWTGFRLWFISSGLHFRFS